MFFLPLQQYSSLPIQINHHGSSSHKLSHSLFLGLLGTAFCQVKVYRRADQRMFLAIGEAIAVQQIGLLSLGQPFQGIVQFPARFLFLHNGLRLHGIRVGYGFNAP